MKLQRLEGGMSESLGALLVGFSSRISDGSHPKIGKIGRGDEVERREKLESGN